MDFAEVFVTPFTYPDNFHVHKMLSDNSYAILNYPDAVSPLDSGADSPKNKESDALLTLLDKVKTTCSLFECD